MNDKKIKIILSKEAKDYIKEVYAATGTVPLTEKNKEENKDKIKDKEIFLKSYCIKKMWKYSENKIISKNSVLYKKKKPFFIVINLSR